MWPVVVLAAALMVGAGHRGTGDDFAWRTQEPARPAPTEIQSSSREAKPTQNPPVKPQTPPLFPRHRRGLYKNGLGLEVMDFTPQSPPLGTDDPSVPDKDAYEVNFTTSADLSKGGKALDLLLVDANYGMEPRLFGHSVPTQVKFEIPVAAAREGDSPLTTGAGPAIAGLKFNFYTDDNNGLSVSVYPQVEFVLPGSDAVARGLADPGQTLMLPVLASKEFKYFTLVANAALHVPVHDPARNVMARLSLGWGLPIRRKLAVMAEVSAESAVDAQRDQLVVINAGIMQGFGRNIIIYGNVGRSVFSDDGSTHTYVGLGLKIVSPRW